MGEDHTLLTFSEPIFDKRCCLGEIASQAWPIEIVLRVTPLLKVYMLSR